MSTPVTPEIGAPENGKQSLSEIARVTNMFMSPSLTFEDIKRNTSWWLPYILAAVVSISFVTIVGKKITWDQVLENSMNQMTEKQKDQMSKLSPEQLQQQQKIILASIKYISYSYPVVVLIVYLVLAAIFLALFNFGAGAEIKFAQAFAVTIFSFVPWLARGILACIMTVIVNDTSKFNMEYPVVTNLGVLVSHAEHPALSSLASSVDIFNLWTVYLMGIGFAIVASKKKSTGLAITFGLYIFYCLLKFGWNLIFA